MLLYSEVCREEEEDEDCAHAYVTGQRSLYHVPLCRGFGFAGKIAKALEIIQYLPPLPSLPSRSKDLLDCKKQSDCIGISSS